MIKVDEKFDLKYIDPSRFCNIRRCPAMFMLSRLMGLKEQGRTMMAADYGTDMHEALPHCYSMDNLSKAQEIFKTRWEARNYPFDDKRNIDNANRTLEEFCGTHSGALCAYKPIKYNVTVPTTTPLSENELPFLCDIGGPLALAGRIDLPIRWNADGSLWALDYKTSQEVSDRLFRNFEGSPAAIAYTLGLSQIAGERAKGLIIEAIRVSKPRAESQMHMIFIQDHQIDNFILQVNRTAEEIISYNEKQEWPQDYSACASYSQFGMAGFICPFKTICDSPDPSSMFKFYDRAEPWHPFDI